MAELKYIAASANRSSNVADIRDDGLIAFGAGHLIALWALDERDTRGLHATVPGHTAPVSALKFAGRSGAAAELLVSGDKAGCVHVWRSCQPGDRLTKWQSVCKLAVASGASVSAIAVHPLEDQLLVCVGDSHARVSVYVVRESTAEQLQTIDAHERYPLDLALARLPDSSSVVLAVAATETRIRLYTTRADSGTQVQFSAAATLEGHTDWVRCLDFVAPITEGTECDYDVKPGELLLASGAQDNYIRLWRVSRAQPIAPTPAASPSKGLSDLETIRNLEAALDGGDGGELRMKAHSFTVENERFSCSSEAVLFGHEAWVTGVHWSPAHSSASKRQLRLLSASADRSMIMWEPTAEPSTSSATSIWTSTERFGELDSTTNLGFFGGLWSAESSTVLAHGWGGAWHVWHRDEQGWEPVVGVSGHHDGARSLAWEPQGRYLLSAGDDMSTRLHAPWRRHSGTTWHELARPQIHGYQVAKVAFTNRLQFVSAADEKILRVFNAPSVFMSTMRTLVGISDLGNETDRPLAASLPPLALSNRALQDANETHAAEGTAPNDPFNTQSRPVDTDQGQHPPFEEQLMVSTLWPEVEKLYGHGYEVLALAAARRRPLIATACKATSVDHTKIRLYSTDNWQQVGQPLGGHALTITNIAFSADDARMVSVSRDRSWRLWQADGETYRPVASSKAHARIVWDVCWAHDDSFFATASRDKTVRVWSLGDNGPTEANVLKFDDAATAVASAAHPTQQHHLLAVGLESGKVVLFAGSAGTSWAQLDIFDPYTLHVLAVTTLRFRPRTQGEQEGQQITLASASEDASVRVYTLAM